ncbi:MAG: FmdB family zinc ribbon protein [Candidatus Bipolaricaulota bacterium]
MPIYRYRCEQCGEEFRELVAVGDGASVRCSACGSPKVMRRLSTFGVVYKGSGFYTTEYRRRGDESGEAKPEKAN